MKFSKRTGWTQEENELTKLLAEKRRRGIPILDLTESNPTHGGFESLNAGLLKFLADPKNLSYDPEPHGLLKAREAICAYYTEKNIQIVPEQIFLTAGTSEAYSFLFRLLADPCDTILAPKPGYPLFDFLSDLNDVCIEKYPLDYSDGWHWDPVKCESTFKNRPSAVILVNPNNPTGNFVSKNEREDAKRLCARFDSAIISDEVFLDIAWSGPARMSFAGNESVLTFTLGGISKMLGLPQMKVSWIVVSGPSPLRREAIRRLEIIADTYLSVNIPSQFALAHWFAHGKKITQEIRERILSNRRCLLDRFRSQANVRVLNAEGGWQAVLQVESSLSDEALVLKLLGDKNILVHPGYFFDFPSGNFLVLSLLPGSRHFQKGLQSLGDFLGAL